MSVGWISLVPHRGSLPVSLCQLAFQQSFRAKSVLPIYRRPSEADKVRRLCDMCNVPAGNATITAIQNQAAVTSATVAMLQIPHGAHPAHHVVLMCMY